MLIKIINNTYGYRPILPNGKKSHYVIPVKPGEPPIEVEKAEADRLIAMGVAEAVGAKNDKALEAKAVKAAPEAVETGNLDAEQLKEMTFDELKTLAKDMGADITGIRSKAGLIEAITAVEVEAGPVLDVQDVID